MAKRFRLLEPAQLGGEVRPRGYEFELGEGVIGPMRTIREGLKLRDVPLYEAIEEKDDDHER
jgi:hypothetical protein